MDKKSLRKYYLEKRNELRKTGLGDLIIKNFQNSNIYKKASSIFITVPIGSEINTIPIITKALSENKKVFLPKTLKEKNQIQPIEITEFPGDLKKGPYDIPEPRNSYVRNSVPELTVVPALVFSTNGYRLGYGGGYYDRYLQNNKTLKVGLSYKDLITEELPHESYDIPVDILVTEDGIIYLNRN